MLPGQREAMGLHLYRHRWLLVDRGLRRSGVWLCKSLLKPFFGNLQIWKFGIWSVKIQREKKIFAYVGGCLRIAVPGKKTKRALSVIMEYSDKD